MLKSFNLYILMRNDLDSMVPGKAAAQASHATSMFEDMMRNDFSHFDEEVLFNYEKWKESGGGHFGTTYVLGCPSRIFENIDENIQEYFNGEGINLSPYGVVHDPTCPIKDGVCTFHLAIDTCSFLFIDKQMIRLLQTNSNDFSENAYSYGSMARDYIKELKLF